MSALTKIEWTETTWNPVRGCSRVSPGCEHCYAERMARRLDGPGRPYEGLTRSGRHGPRWSGVVRTVPEAMTQPLSWRKPRLVFVNSMSDLFHENIPDAVVEQVFDTMARADWHTFQVLTKRSTRLRELGPRLHWPDNVWMGVSVESEHWLPRVDDLRGIPAAVRFISAEPLLGPLSMLNLAGIDWLIAGGESGAGARPMSSEWVRDLRNQCSHAGVAFFFKQWGGLYKKRTGRTLDGRTWDELPPRHRAPVTRRTANRTR